MKRDEFKFGFKELLISFQRNLLLGAFAYSLAALLIFIYFFFFLQLTVFCHLPQHSTYDLLNKAKIKRANFLDGFHCYYYSSDYDR